MSRPDSIKNIGLKKYLDDNIVKHNGFHYDGFVNMLENGVSITSMARAFNVTRFTVNKWISVYREEQSKPVSQN